MSGKLLPIGERVAALRQAKKVTQNELAQYLHISYQSVSKWETGAAYPDIGLLPAIAQYFNVSADYLLGMDDRSVISKRYFLAADQGGTKTRVLLCDFSGKIYDEIRTGGVCWFYGGIEKSMEYLGEAADTLRARCKIDAGEIAFIVCGAAGINWDDERGMFTQALERRLNIKAYVYNDCAAAVYCDGLEYENRILLCAGTEFGASVVTRDMSDPFVYCNHTMPEDMGATAIGSYAVTAVLRAEEYLGKPTALTRHILSYFELDSENALLSAYARKTLTRPVKGLTPLVFEMARCGDTVSGEILRRMADNMSRYAVAAVQKYQLARRKTAVLLAGGVFCNEYEPFYTRIADNIHAVCENAVIIRTAKEPVFGAYQIGLMKAKQFMDSRKAE